MEISPVLPAGAPLIGGYGAGGFTLASGRHSGVLWLTPAGPQPLPTGLPANPAEVFSGDLLAVLQPVFSAGVLLLGLGAQCSQLPPAHWRAAAREKHCVVEAMTTAAACRTWNVLLSEGRQVQALLWPVDG